MIDSDLHNFNKKCIQELEFIKKPRSIFCEHRVYSKTSSFRDFIEQITSGELKLLPRLTIDQAKSAPTLDYQKIEFLKLDVISRPLSESEVYQMGGILALMNVLGVCDLHKTNILFGEVSGEIYFAPIDLEIFFQQFNYEKMGMTPHGGEHLRCCSGVSHFVEYLEKCPDIHFTAKLIYGYKKYLKLFFDNIDLLYESFFGGVCVDQLPSRVLLRPTKDYVRALELKSFKSFFLEEQVQLARGDVPYFFTLLDGDNKIYYWRDGQSFAPIESVPKWLDLNLVVKPKLNYENMVRSFFLICRDLDSVMKDDFLISACHDVKVIHKGRVKIVTADNMYARIDAKIPVSIDSDSHLFM